MTSDEAKNLLGVSGVEFSQTDLRERYWARVKEYTSVGKDLAPLNLAHELLEKEIGRGDMLTIPRQNAAVSAPAERDIQSVQRTATDQLAQNVGGAFVRLVRTAQGMRDAALVAAGISGIASFALGSLDLSTRLRERQLDDGINSSLNNLVKWVAYNEIPAMVVLWMFVIFFGVQAFFLNMQVRRLQAAKDDTVKQLARATNRSIILDKVLGDVGSSVRLADFQERLEAEIYSTLRSNRMPYFVRRMRQEISADFEDYLLAAGSIETYRENGDRHVRRLRND